MNNCTKNNMTCPHCILRDGKTLCKINGYLSCSKLRCPIEKDNYDENYGSSD